MSELEEWLRSTRMYDAGMEETLEPLVQVAQLLQVKKRTSDDVDLICDTCTKLTVTQVKYMKSMFERYSICKTTFLIAVCKGVTRLKQVGVNR